MYSMCRLVGTKRSPDYYIKILQLKNNPHDISKQEWHSYMQTKIIKSSTNETSRAVHIDYQFQTKQVFCLEVHLEGEEDIFGSCEVSLAEILKSENWKLNLPLDVEINDKVSLKRPPSLEIIAQEVKDDRNILSLHLRGVKLARKNFGGFGSSDPFFIIYQLHENGEKIKVHESKVCKRTLYPDWEHEVLSLSKICNGDIYKTILIEIFDWEKSTKHRYIGTVETTINQFRKKLFHDVYDVGKKHKVAGQVKVVKCEIIERYSFIQYLQGGVDMKVSIAIDFTSSNKPPFDPQSLHYMDSDFFFDRAKFDPKQLNDYQKAIVSLGRILEDYDSDNLWSVYGFGANLRNRSNDFDPHCFPLTFDKDNHEVEGMSGVLEAYSKALSQVSLSGPTYFNKLIKAVNKRCKKVTQKEQEYNILLILTDGIINDMAETIDQVILSSAKPISIIIVGIGTADFSEMRELDADGRLLSQNGKKALRDCVQFVSFSQLKNNIGDLAEETLREIPQQVEQYFSVKGLPPNL